MTKVYLKMDQTPLPWRGWGRVYPPLTPPEEGNTQLLLIRGRVYPPLTPPREGTKNKTTCENY